MKILKYSDVLEVPTVITLISLNVAVYLNYKAHILLLMCHSWFADIWPLNYKYSIKLTQLNVSYENSCYVRNALSINFIVLILSFLIAFVCRVRSDWFRGKMVVEGNWPIKALIFVMIMSAFLLWYNFSRDTSLSSLNVDRPLWISIMMITAMMSVMLMIVLHLLLYCIRRIFYAGQSSRYRV